VSLTAPDGDPDELYSLAKQLDAAAAAASGLGHDTPTTMSSIQKQAKWTGQAATASMNLSADLGDGVAATSVQLTTIATEVRSYAGALANAQAKVAAYNRSATDAEVAGWTDAGTSAVMQAAGSAAQSALDAWQQAGTQAASRIAAATKQLGGVFPAGKPVRTYLATLPAEIDPYAVSSSTGTGLVTSGLPLSSDYVLSPEAGSDSAPPAVTGNQPFGYLFRELIAPEGDPVPIPVYDPQYQVNRTDGLLPTGIINVAGTPPRPQTKEYRTQEKNGYVPDQKTDWISEPGPA
jgi:uncharacterized protein YukE